MKLLELSADNALELRCGKLLHRFPKTMDLRLTADADALTAHLGFDKVVVIVHSYRGFVALRHSDRVSHLILRDTAPTFNYPDEIMANVLHKWAAEGMMSALVAEIMHEGIPNSELVIFEGGGHLPYVECKQYSTLLAKSCESISEGVGCTEAENSWQGARDANPQLRSRDP